MRVLGLMDAVLRVTSSASCVTDKICYVIDVGALSAAELLVLRGRVLHEIRRRSIPQRHCERCASEFVGRADARYCSPKCRTAAHRMRDKKEIPQMSTIVGIGYEGQTLDAFISKIRLRGVETLVDVRLNAISRKRGFSKTALSEAVRAAGIEYVHMPELGNHRNNRDGYATTDTIEAHQARDRFRDVLTSDKATKALRELASLASDRTIALFCFEADEDHCHRQQVREALTSLTSLTIHDLVAG